MPICVLNFLWKRWLIWDTSWLTHYSLLILLLVAIDLHYVVYNIEVIIDCVSSREDVLCTWSCIIRLQVVSSWYLRYRLISVICFFKEIVIEWSWVVIEVLRIVSLSRNFINPFNWLLIYLSSWLIGNFRLLFFQCYLYINLFNMFILVRMWPLDIQVLLLNCLLYEKWILHPRII